MITFGWASDLDTKEWTYLLYKLNQRVNQMGPQQRDMEKKRERENRSTG